MAKIVVCDDSNSILTLFEMKLNQAGHKVIGKAKDGLEGLQLFIELRPDLTLLDVTMPNKDGRECLEDIMRLDPKAKVIMVSAISDESVITSCLAGGAKAFISKEKLYKNEEFKTDILALLETVLKVA